MITSIFKKSSPLNYTIVVLLVIVIILLINFKQGIWLKTIENTTYFGINFILLFGSLFITNFIVKKNGLTKDSTYSILFFSLFLMFFPSLLMNNKLIISNFFILLALRRLISLQTLKAPKEKIFDASLWIFVACLFHYWSILFIFLVYVSISYHVSRDYRNWLIPFVSLFVTVVIYFFISLVLGRDMIKTFSSIGIVDFNMGYFKNVNENLALSIYSVVAIYFLFSKIIALTKRPLILQSSYKKIIFAFIIGLIIFIISPNKNNDLLVFTFFPLSVMATNAIEYSKNKILKEMVLAFTIILVFCCYFMQL